MTVKLHCFGESGNAYKAALTLELAGMNWEPIFVDFFGVDRRDWKMIISSIILGISATLIWGTNYIF